MKQKSLLFMLCMLFFGMTGMSGLQAQTVVPSRPLNVFVASASTRSVSYEEQTLKIGVGTESEYAATTDVSWMELTKEADGISVSVSANYSNKPRTGVITISSNGNERDITITQELCPQATGPFSSLDLLIPVKTFTSTFPAETANDNTPLSNAFDGLPSTIYHSAWSGYSVSASNPCTMEFTFVEPSFLETMQYMARINSNGQDGNNNGNWGLVDLYYQTSDAADYTLLEENHNFNNASGTVRFDKPNVSKVKVVIKSAYHGNVSAGEIRFFSGFEHAAGISLAVSEATATSFHNNEPITSSFDGSLSTIWHSNYGSEEGTGPTVINASNPVTLTYTMEEPSHVDYAFYYPRIQGTNGNFTTIGSVSYRTTGQETFTTIASYNNASTGGTANGSVFFLNGTEGVDNVEQVKFVIKGGAGNFASCAEMQFVDFSGNNIYSTFADDIFADDLYTTLRNDVTQEKINAMDNALLKSVAQQLFDNKYSMKYRVRRGVPCHQSPGTLSYNILNMAFSFDPYENETGIYFDQGEKVAVAVSGLNPSFPAKLMVKCFGKEPYSAQCEYTLQNGINYITVANRGLGYIKYLRDHDFNDAPLINVHFLNAKEAGYFSLVRGDTNDDWKELLATTCSDIVDIVTKRTHILCETSTLASTCPANGVEIAQMYDDVMKAEWDVMGFLDYKGREPALRMCARPTTSGLYAQGEGAWCQFSSWSSWCNPLSLDIWGLAHEWGHCNQTNNKAFKWNGTTEVTNNLYSAWVQHVVGTNGFHRLEDEGNPRGQHLQNYIQGAIVRKQDHLEDFGSGDVFATMAPLWQLQVYSEVAHRANRPYPKFFESARVNDAAIRGMTAGEKRLNFVRTVCDSTQINFIPFFTTAGFVHLFDKEMSDYGSNERHTVTQSMIDDLVNYVKSKPYGNNYCDGGINFIHIYNAHIFRDRLKLNCTYPVNSGCSVVANGARIRIDGEIWKNAVGFKTYAANGTLLYATMLGYGEAQQTSRYTQVNWTGNGTPAYITAVGFDGEEVLCYKSPEFLKATISSATADQEETVGETAPNGRINAAIDGNTTTFYHSPWKDASTTYPVNFEFTLSELTDINECIYVQRATQGHYFDEVQFFYSSEEEGETWNEIGTHHFDGSSIRQSYVFPSMVTARRIKMVIKSSHDTSANKYISAAEIEFGYTLDQATIQQQIDIVNSQINQ